MALTLAERNKRKIVTLISRARIFKRAFVEAIDALYEIDEAEGDRVRAALENFPHG
jgi:hypothetical protein